MTATLYFYMAPQSGIEPPYYALRPLRLINSQVSYQLEYRGMENGIQSRDQTYNRSPIKQVLYQLSYPDKSIKKLTEML